MQEEVNQLTEPLRENQSDDQILAALNDPANGFVRRFKRRSIVATPRGRRYHVNDDGTFRPLNKSKENERRQRQMERRKKKQ